MNRRRRILVTNPDGSITDLDTLNWYLASLIRPRTVVERLSLRESAIREFEATARGIRAERAA